MENTNGTFAPKAFGRRMYTAEAGDRLYTTATILRMPKGWAWNVEQTSDLAKGAQGIAGGSVHNLTTAKLNALCAMSIAAKY